MQTFQPLLLKLLIWKCSVQTSLELESTCAADIFFRNHHILALGATNIWLVWSSPMPSTVSRKVRVVHSGAAPNKIYFFIDSTLDMRLLPSRCINAHKLQKYDITHCTPTQEIGMRAQPLTFSSALFSQGTLDLRKRRDLVPCNKFYLILILKNF